MGCNCKSKINRKYTDGKDDGRVERSSFGVVVHKIMNAIVYLFVIVFAIALVPVSIVFVVVMKAVGKEAVVKSPFFDKIAKYKKNAGTENV